MRKKQGGVYLRRDLISGSLMYGYQNILPLASKILASDSAHFIELKRLSL